MCLICYSAGGVDFCGHGHEMHPRCIHKWCTNKNVPNWTAHAHKIGTDCPLQLTTSCPFCTNTIVLRTQHRHTRQLLTAHNELAWLMCRLFTHDAQCASTFSACAECQAHTDLTVKKGWCSACGAIDHLKIMRFTQRDGTHAWLCGACAAHCAQAPDTSGVVFTFQDQLPVLFDLFGVVKKYRHEIRKNFAMYRTLMRHLFDLKLYVLNNLNRQPHLQPLAAALRSLQLF